MKSLITVSAASDSYRLTTADAVRTALELESTVGDSFINATIDRQSAAAANWCRCVFAKQSYSETFRDVWCTEAIALKHYPITAIASITVDGTALTGSEYEYDAATGFIYRLSSDARIEWSGSKIVIAYTAGYVLPAQTLIGATPITPATDRTLPHDIEAAVIELVKAEFYARDRDPLLRSIDVSGVQSESYTVTAMSDGAMAPRIAAMLSPYRRLVIG